MMREKNTSCEMREINLVYSKKKSPQQAADSYSFN